MRRVLPDLLVALWCLAWLIAGTTVAANVREAAEAGDTLVAVGQAVQTTGNSIANIDLPLVGKKLGGPGRDIAQVGRETITAGRDQRAGTEDLASLLGWIVALVPTLPLLATYLPPRLRRERERRAIVRALKADPVGARRLLAHRALMNAPLDEVLAVSKDPLGEVDNGRSPQLAKLEADRLGLELSSSPS